MERIPRFIDDKISLSEYRVSDLLILLTNRFLNTNADMENMTFESLLLTDETKDFIKNMEISSYNVCCLLALSRTLDMSFKIDDIDKWQKCLLYIHEKIKCELFPEFCQQSV